MQTKTPERVAYNRHETATEQGIERGTSSRDPTPKSPKREEGGTVVEFRLVAKKAQSVAVAGSFNGWDAKKDLLKKDGDCWKARLTLPKGRHEYRFIVDGVWLNDPNAKEWVTNPYGGTNSIVSS
jgi:1,4-alpha-glucan branching enzyme